MGGSWPLLDDALKKVFFQDDFPNLVSAWTEWKIPLGVGTISPDWNVKETAQISI